jgi:hypothetical protein
LTLLFSNALRVLTAGAVIAATAFAITPTVAEAGSAPVVGPCHACGRNLIANPGAEAGKGTATDSVVKVPDWKQTGAFTAAQYAWDADLSTTTPGPTNRGKNYFYGGPSAMLSTGTQLIKVGTGGISSGRVSYVLSAWLGGYSNQPDNAQLIVTFESASGTALKTTKIGPVTVGERHDVSGLFFRQHTGKVPAGTEKIKVELEMMLREGGDNDGLADNLSLVFSYK